jgi:hypothetical protein
MNKERRNKIAKIIQEIERIKDGLQSVLNDEEFAFDNMPENLQSSMRGEESEEAIDIMNEVVDALAEAMDRLCEIG